MAKNGCFQIGSLLLLPLLAGCAAGVISNGMKPLVGQPVSAVFAKLGIPTAEQTIAGMKIYIWSTNYLVEGSTVSCRIRAMVDTREIVTSWDFEGGERGCSKYVSSLM